MRRFAVVCVAALVSLNGCSIIFVTPRHRSPSPSGEQRGLGCTINYLPPVLDSLLLIPPAIRAGTALDKSDADYQGAAIPRTADLGLGLALSALFVASAIYGYAAVSDCREAYAKLGKPLPD